MQAFRHLVLAPSQISLVGGGRCSWVGPSSLANSRRRRRFATLVTASGRRSHYSVLGIPPNASSSDIKRAYRLLALKYHPDVNKEAGAHENFKSIRLAYEILMNEMTRTEYDRALRHHLHQPSTRGSLEYEYEDSRRWTYPEKYCVQGWGQYDTTTTSSNDQSSFDEDSEERRESFAEVLRSSFISLFLMQTLGIRLSLTFSGVMALIDRKLDAGYKLGYLFAWILGGRAGILLALFLTFARWICGKNSSAHVALVVVAMWCCSNIARHYGPIPQGALLTLLYMSSNNLKSEF